MEQPSCIPNLFLFSITIPKPIEQTANERFEIVLKSSRADFVTQNEIISDLIFRPDENPIFYNKNIKKGGTTNTPPIVLTLSGYRLLSERNDPNSVACTCFVPQRLEAAEAFVNAPQEISEILKKTVGEENFSLEAQTQIYLNNAQDWKGLDAVYDFVLNYEETSQLKQKLNTNLSQTKKQKKSCKI